MGFNQAKAKLAEEEFIKDPCNRTRNEMIMHHTGIVHMIVRKYYKFLSDDHYDDLFQEGMIGLMTASKKFDPGKKVKFATYAGWWVRSAIQSFIIDERATYFNTIKKLAFDKNPGKKLPNEDERRSLALRHPVPLTDPVKNRPSKEHYVTWQDIIADPEVDLEKSLINVDEIELLYTIAKPFLKNGRHKKIFTERLVADNPKTLRELGKDLNLSREGVRLHEKALLAKIFQAYREYCQI